jgi:hypothetical protein
MLILQLLIAHLLGDFVFQSNDLILKKFKSWKGTFHHALIIAFFSILAIFPYWGSTKAWTLIALIFGIHFAQDVLKIEYEKRFNSKRSVWPFFLDQIFHWSLILVLARGFQKEQMLTLPSWLIHIHQSSTILCFVLGLLLVSFVWEITIYQFARRKNAKLKYSPNRQEMLWRVGLFSLSYFMIRLLA